MVDVRSRQILSAPFDINSIDIGTCEPANPHVSKIAKQSSGTASPIQDPIVAVQLPTEPFFEMIRQALGC